MFRFLHDDSGGGRGAGGDNKTAATNATSDKSTIAMMLTSALPKACETGCLLLLDDPLLDVWHGDVSCAYPVWCHTRGKSHVLHSMCYVLQLERPALYRRPQTLLDSVRLYTQTVSAQKGPPEPLKRQNSCHRKHTESEQPIQGAGVSEDEGMRVSQ